MQSLARDIAIVSTAWTPLTPPPIYFFVPKTFDTQAEYRAASRVYRRMFIESGNGHQDRERRVRIALTTPRCEASQSKIFARQSKRDCRREIRPGDRQSRLDSSRSAEGDARQSQREDVFVRCCTGRSTSDGLSILAKLADSSARRVSTLMSICWSVPTSALAWPLGKSSRRNSDTFSVATRFIADTTSFTIHGQSNRLPALSLRCTDDWRKAIGCATTKRSLISRQRFSRIA